MISRDLFVNGILWECDVPEVGGESFAWYVSSNFVSSSNFTSVYPFHSLIYHLLESRAFS